MKKVVLIGAGNIGRQALECLGSELVAHFVENRKAGFSYLGKPVYPMEKLLEDCGKYLLLLTIADIEYRDEFIEQLNQMGIDDYYFFEQAIYRGSIFQRSDMQEYTRRTLSEDMVGINPKRVCVLGRKRKIGRFIAALFEIETFYEEEEACAISAWSDRYDYVFVNARNYSSELHEQLREIRDKGIKLFYIAHYYDCYNFLAKRGLKEFAGKFKKKKRCFIIGSGPSLTPQDLDVLAEHNEFCFGSNMIHRIYPKTKWRPDYLCICDYYVMQSLNVVLENNSCPMFLADAVSLYFSPFQYEDQNLFRVMFNRDDFYRILQFGSDLSSGNIPSGFTISYTLIELAVYMGFEEIYLLGMDNSNLTKHFSDDYATGVVAQEIVHEALHLIIFRNAFKRAKAAAAEYGFKIYNATRGGYLEEFERVDFDALFQ